MKKIIVLMSVLSIVSSCSNKSETKKSNSVRFTVLSENPVFPKIQKLNCSGEFISPLVETSVRFLNHGVMDYLTLLQSDYKGSDNRILIPAFNQTLAGFVEDKRYIYHFDEQEGYLAEVIKDFTDEGRNSEVCPELTQIEPNTVENATLLVSHFVDKTYNAITSNGIYLSKLKFKVAPSIYTYLLVNGGPLGDNKYNRKGFQTDNAYYSPSDQEIVFLPPSKEGIEKGLFGGTPLWEIPMVASHEYGHHVFNTIMTNYETRSTETSHHLCFNNEIHSGFSEQQDNLVRETDIHEAISSMNEGFADLVSYYSLNPEESSLKDVTCMEENRDLSFDHFLNGDKKVFSKKVIALMKNPVAKKTTSKCSDPDFQEIHDLGAVFASIVNQTLTYYVASTNEAEIRSQKLSITLAWLKKLNENYTNDFKEVGIEAGFQKAYELLIQTAIDETNIDVSSLCKFVESNFASMNSSYNFKYLTTCN